jgi:hypothetical protein
MPSHKWSYFTSVKSYRSKPFKNNFSKNLKTLLKQKPKSLKLKKSRGWIFVTSSKKFVRNKSIKWAPKLYICVEAKYYWKTLEQLMVLTSEKNLACKFWAKASGADRRDKVAIYFHDQRQLKACIKQIRASLKGAKFHNLSHCSSSKDLGLEPMAGGIYVGLDPLFLKGISWRIYHTVISRLIHDNADFFNKASPSKFRKNLKLLNISLKHAGPASLTPSIKNIKYIKAVWKKFIT